MKKICNLDEHMELCNKRTLVESTGAVFSVKIDERGRISLPSEIRKTFGLNKGDFIDMSVSVTRSEVVINFGITENSFSVTQNKMS